MMTKAEILKLVEKVDLLAESMSTVGMILRNFGDNDPVTLEKLEVICKLIIKN